MKSPDKRAAANAVRSKAGKSSQGDTAKVPDLLTNSASEQWALVDSDGTLDMLIADALMNVLRAALTNQWWIAFTFNAKRTAVKILMMKGSARGENWFTNAEEIDLLALQIVGKVPTVGG